MARFWVGGGSSTNWSATANTNWATASGGANNQTVPDIAQDVTFDGAGSGNGASVVSANITVLSLTFTAGYTNTITINTAVTLTIAGNFTDRTNHTWVVSGTGAMTISAASTITSNSKTFPGPVTFSGANTKTLVGDWVITGTLTGSAGGVTINKTTAEKLSCAGLSVGTAMLGSITIKLTGGTWSGNSANSIATMEFAGTSTFSATGTYTGTINYTSGTITTSGSTLTLGTNPTLNTNGVSWNNVTTNNAGTFTLGSLLTVTGTLTLSTSNPTTFAGSGGFMVGTWIIPPISASTVTLVNGVTYTVTTALTCNQSRVGSILTIASDDGTLKAILTLQNGATCNVLANFTRIDASNGRAIWAYNGTITTCNNIFSFNDALPPAMSRVIHAGASY